MAEALADDKAASVSEISEEHVHTSSQFFLSLQQSASLVQGFPTSANACATSSSRRNATTMRNKTRISKKMETKPKIEGKKDQGYSQKYHHHPGHHQSPITKAASSPPCPVPSILSSPVPFHPATRLHPLVPPHPLSTFETSKNATKKNSVNTLLCLRQ